MITTKQRAKLRSMANGLDTIFQIGKDGLTNVIVKELYDVLEKRELVKIRVLESSGITARELAGELADRLGCEIVQVIGSRCVVYRESRENKRIILD